MIILIPHRASIRFQARSLQVVMIRGRAYGLCVFWLLLPLAYF